MKNLQGVVSVAEAAEAGSFTAAAQRMGLTPAAVSKNVARLEAQLGVRLFQRSPRQLRITPEGQAFLDQARPALAALEAAVAGTVRAGAEVCGRVRVSASQAFGRRHVLPLLPELLARHPGLEIELRLEDRQVDLVAEGFDIGVRGAALVDSQWVARPVARLPTVLVASPAYLARAGTPRRPADLLRHQLLGVRYADGSPACWGFAGQAPWLPPARLWCSDPQAPVVLALEGAGICETGLHHVVDELAQGRLKVLLHGQHDPGVREIALHYTHRRYLLPRVRVVVEGLLSGLRDRPALRGSVQDLPAAWCAEPREPAGGRAAPSGPID